MPKNKFKTLQCACGKSVAVDDRAVSVTCSDCIIGRGPTMTLEEEQEYYKKVEEAKNKPRRKVRGVGTFARSLLRENPEISAEECVQQVKAQYPDSKFDVSHYKFYKCQIKRNIA